MGKYLKEKEKTCRPRWLIILLDLLLTGAILVVFAFFHHVLPAIRAAMSHPEISVTTPVTVPGASETVPGQTVPASTEADTRTPWQKQFADHFTDEVVSTDRSYTSPNVSVTLNTVTVGEGSKQIVYHVADIYVASLDCFVSTTAHRDMVYFDTQNAKEMDEAADAVLSISGDFLTYQKRGFLVRNGQVYKNDSNHVSICALFPDGTMETYDPQGYEISDIMERGAVQVWSFGPRLLDENGQARSSSVLNNLVRNKAVRQPNPRSALGYYEPGHYCFVVVDGRQKGYSAGMSLEQLAQVFQELGCTQAYNLDGGGSAVMHFRHEPYSRQSNGGDRKLGDLLVIRDKAKEAS